MRGKIIHYRADDGSGRVSAAGKQYGFHIGDWQGDTAPTVNRVVDLEINGDTLMSLAPVSDEVLLREKASELKAKLGGAGELLGGSGGEIGQNILAQLGLPLAIAYGVFFLASVLLGFGALKGLTLSEASSTLYGTVDLLARSGKGNFTVLLFAAYASFLVPVFWKHRFAPLATLLPLLVVVLVVLQIHSIYAEANSMYLAQVHEAQRLLGSFARDLAKDAKGIYPSFAEFFSAGLGAYLCFAAGLAIAWLGAGKLLLTLRRGGAAPAAA